MKTTDQKTSLHIAVLGAGSVGCYVGGRLAAGGARVTFIGRARYQKALAQRGLTLTHFAQDKTHVPPEAFDFVTKPKGLAGALSLIHI